MLGEPHQGQGVFLRLFFSPWESERKRAELWSPRQGSLKREHPREISQKHRSHGLSCQRNVGCFSQIHEIRASKIFPLLLLFRVNMSFKANTGGAGPGEARHASPDGLPLGPSMKVPAGARCTWGS